MAGNGKDQKLAHTVENSAIGREETVLQALSIVTRLESVLLEDNVVNVLAGKQCHLVTTVSVEDTEEGQLAGVRLG